MQEIDVAVVIVTYKCAALTVDCLRSVAAERSDPNIRIRVVARWIFDVVRSRKPVMHILGQSTSVTDTRTGPKRLPAYWFESRRRYFVMTYGVGGAIVIDIAALIANSVGLIKRIARRRNRPVLHYIRDLLRHSTLWPRDSNMPAIRHFQPPKSHT